MNVKVKAFPSSSKEKVLEIGGDNETRRFEMYVKEPPERNLANARIRFLVARECRVSLENVRMLTGHRSRNKTFVVKNGVV